MNWLMNFMRGRYGVDQFSIFLMVCAVVVSLVSAIFSFPFIWVLNYLLIGFYIFRTLSKNIYKRQSENEKFMILFNPFKRKFAVLLRKFKERKTYKYYKCPKCKAQLRVPKGRGKILLSCPKCKTQFQKTT